MKLFLLFWTLYLFPVIYGRHIKPDIDTSTKKENVKTMFDSILENMKSFLKGLRATGHVSSAKDDTARWMVKENQNRMQQKLGSSSLKTTSIAPSRSSLKSTPLVSFERSAEAPNRKEATTVSTLTPASVSSQKATASGSSKTALTWKDTATISKLIPSSVRSKEPTIRQGTTTVPVGIPTRFIQLEANLKSTTTIDIKQLQSRRAPSKTPIVTDVQQVKGAQSNTGATTHDSMTTVLNRKEGESTGSIVSVLREKKAIKPTTAATTTTKTVKKAKLDPKCLTLIELNAPLPTACRRDKGSIPTWS